MRLKIITPCLLVIVLLSGSLYPVARARAAPPGSSLASVSAYELINAMNTLRVSYGYSALIEDAIIDSVAQATAEYMAANLMSWHIGDVRGRLAAAGYGGGATVWATENFAVGYDMSIDEIMQVWSDSEHMRPATVAAYCNVGAGVAKASNGMTYYVLQAAYTSANYCGPYNYSGGTSEPDATSQVSQLIVPVQTATPDEDGRTYHVVASGQSLWSIAIAYKVTIHDLEVWNNISRDDPLWVGERLFIPSSNTEGYATPTPVGMVVPSTPDADGKIIHIVQAYQTLTTIAAAYKVTVEAILALNYLQADWPLQIGQHLLIFPGWVTPSPTPRPLTPLEKLTPASDGNYYHVVQSGETLSWIASLYEVSLANLMAWNGLTADSIIRPEEKLILQVTPPVPPTRTPAPPTVTATATPQASPTLRPATRTPSPSAPAAAETPTSQQVDLAVVGPVILVVVAAGLLGLGWWAWKRR
jgi:LysM repeat protein